MKRFEDLSKKEILNLSDEQIGMYIDMKCAENGVPLLPLKPIEPQTVNFGPDITVYKVGEYAFTNAEEAENLLDLIKTLDVYNLDWQYVKSASRYVLKRFADTDNAIGIEAKKVYSEEFWNSIKDKLDEYDRTMKTYNEDKNAYDKIFNSRENLAADIWDRIEAVKDNERLKNKLRTEFERYLKLTDGNKNIAFKFLEDAHKEINNIDDKDEFVKELLTVDDDCSCTGAII